MWTHERSPSFTVKYIWPTCSVSSSIHIGGKHTETMYCVWFCCYSFMSWQHLMPYHQGYWLVTYYAHGVFIVPHLVWLLRFYVLTTSKIIAGWLPTCDSAHSRWLYSAAPLGDPVITITQFLTQSHYPETELTSPCPSLVVLPSPRLGSDVYQFCRSLVWPDQEYNSRPSIWKACILTSTDSVWCTMSKSWLMLLMVYTFDGVPRQQLVFVLLCSCLIHTWGMAQVT